VPLKNIEITFDVVDKRGRVIRQFESTTTGRKHNKLLNRLFWRVTVPQFIVFGLAYIAMIAFITRAQT